MGLGIGVPATLHHLHLKALHLAQYGHIVDMCGWKDKWTDEQKVSFQGPNAHEPSKFLQ